MDRRTDGQTEFSSQYRVCITCSAVKNKQRYLRVCFVMPVFKVVAQWHCSRARASEGPARLMNFCQRLGVEAFGCSM